MCEKDSGICSNENMEDGNNLTSKESKIKTEVERCNMKIHYVKRSTERRSTGPDNLENENSMHRSQIEQSGQPDICA